MSVTKALNKNIDIRGITSVYDLIWRCEVWTWSIDMSLVECSNSIYSRGPGERMSVCSFFLLLLFYKKRNERNFWNEF